MYAKKSDEQGPRRGRSFDSVNSAFEEKKLNNEVSSINDAYILCFFDKLIKPLYSDRNKLTKTLMYSFSVLIYLKVICNKANQDVDHCNSNKK